MALLIEDQPSCSIAWLKAAKAVDERPKHEAHNVIIEILDPLRRTTDDRNIEKSVNCFLKKHQVYSLSTVANTIFPWALSRQHSGESLYAAYLRILPKISEGSWGTYFGRMIKHQTADNQIINPLQKHIIERLRKCVHGKGPTYRNIYELRIYDPDTNISIHNPGTETERRMGGPCLSFMSFKLDNQNRLLLTALYRNHYYIQRLLGNMI